jgi:murein L,D-transpeptidase YcbB/YkuD
MKKEEKFGFLDLAKKSLAVLTASMSALLPSQGKALPTPSHLEGGVKRLDYGNFQMKMLKSKLVLKINPISPERFLLAQHASHSSHSSHASHSSHYSSSPTYTPSTTNYPSSTETKTSPTGLTSHTLGSRLLYKGCEGTDVEELQKLLLKLGYDDIASGYFGDKTEEAVKKFQKRHELNRDGRVGDKTLSTLKSQ